MVKLPGLMPMIVEASPMYERDCDMFFLKKMGFLNPPTYMSIPFFRTPDSDTPGADAPAVVAPKKCNRTVLSNCENLRFRINPGPPDIFSGVGQGVVRASPVREIEHACVSIQSFQQRRKFLF